MWWRVALLVEFVALLIALVMPITPSKTGSDASLAELFVRDPGYGQEVVVYFAFTNLLIGLVGAGFALYSRLRGVQRGSGGSS